ncbi:hypothetical protein FQN52_000676 [Onygenales sp. PD_12]|nr:hypothetical protein FQN52_000676 [Onygenales sp. PD_12]
MSRLNVTLLFRSAIGAVTMKPLARSQEPREGLVGRKTSSPWRTLVHDPERLERIEKILAEKLEDRQHFNGGSRFSTVATLDTPNASNTAPYPQAVRPHFRKLHFAGLRLGDISSCNGVPLFSPEGIQWVESRTGQRINSDRLCPFLGLPWQNHPPQYLGADFRDNTSISDTTGLPDIRLLREYISAFSRAPIRLAFPFIDPVLFEDTVRLAYQPSSNYQHGTNSAKACICSFMAVAGLFNFHETEAGTAVESEAYAWKAHSLLHRMAPEVTLDGLQTSIMLLVFNLLSGKIQLAVFMTGLASRLIFMMGAHIRRPECISQLGTSDPQFQQRTDIQLRNLFWICYALDKELSLRSGQPPAIGDEHCDLDLPPDYGRHLELGSRKYVSSGAVIDVPILGDLRLSRLKSKAYSMLYSVQALKKSDAELLRSIRELDNDLETWRLSVPLGCRPTLSFSKDASVPDKDMDMCTVMLRLEYHHCMAIIHQASGRCVAWSSHQNGVMEGVSSSLALSVESSRSSLAYLHTAHCVLPDDSFWVIVFYPMSAVLTLFCNLLLNPLDCRATEDLELLSKVPALVRALPISRLTVNELMHIKNLDDFVAELSRLAKCAVAKATECPPEPRP